MNQAYDIGTELVNALKSNDFSYRGKQGICPWCHDSLIRILSDNKSVECPLCGVRGEIQIIDEKIKIRFDEKDSSRVRLTLKNMYNHFNYHIQPSKQYFIMTKEERKLKSAELKEYLKP